MCCFVILSLFNEMQINTSFFSAIPHIGRRVQSSGQLQKLWMPGLDVQFQRNISIPTPWKVNENSYGVESLKPKF